MYMCYLLVSPLTNSDDIIRSRFNRVRSVLKATLTRTATGWSEFYYTAVISKALICNSPRSIHPYSNMALRLSGQTSLFGVAIFVCKSLLEIEGQKKLKILVIVITKYAPAFFYFC